MLAMQDPGLAYRRSSFDARLVAATPADMVMICLDDLLASLVRFEQADLRDDREVRSRALTRAIASLTALEMGVDRSAPLGRSLLQIYTAAKSALLGMMVSIEVGTLHRIRADFSELRDSFQKV